MTTDRAGGRDEDCLSGGGEMGRLMRAHDWSKTPVGPVARWPKSLKVAIGIILGSRYPMFVWWGRRMTVFHNDAYVPILGKRHPEALGRSGPEVWSELWEGIRTLIEPVLDEGRACWAEEHLLLMERNGYLEEAYFTFSYSPIPDDDGGIGGIFCACSEDTGRVLGQRRLRTLRELAARTAEARTTPDACAIIAEVLAGDRHDLPFALLYLLDPDGRAARLESSSGLVDDSPLRVPGVEVGEASESPWPFARVVESGRAEVVGGLADRALLQPGAAWPEPPDSALVLPVRRSGQDRPAAFLVAGLNTRRVLDDDYRGFLDLLTAQIATALANARASEEERRRAESLAELDRAKTAFFSNVSHEFRTPLSLMLGPVEDILSDPGRVGDEERESLGLVHRNALRLQKLVNNLLDFSRIEAGRVRATYEPTDLAGFTAELASNFRSACERAGLELRVDCQALPGPVFVDRDMWEKVVLNLLSNAFKFTHRGGIDVRLRAVGGRAELTVRDSGTGIPADEIPRLFERFHRIEGAGGRTQEGSGIGLAMVRELAHLHGGEVRAESEYRVGSTFVVAIPLGSGHLPAEQIGTARPFDSTALGAIPYVEEALRWLPDRAPSKSVPGPSAVAPSRLDGTPEAAPLASPASPRPRILLADDNADMRDYVRRLLSGRYDVTAVGDGLSALEEARNRPPDLVLSDVMMPGLDGFGLLRELRSHPRTRDVPVLLLSARAGEEARVEGLESGADDYLTKPFNARELLARVGSQLDLHRLRREAERERRRGDERSRAILESISDAFFAVDRSWRFSYVNRQADRLLRREPGELIGKSLWEEYPGLAGSEFERAYRRAMDERVPTLVTAHYADHARWYEVHCYPAPEGLSVYFRDVSERARAEERERQLLAEAATANAQFRAFFEQGALFAGIMSVDGRIIESNRLALEGCGFAREEVVGRPFWECPWWSPSPELAGRIRDATARAAVGQTIRAELPYFVADGSERIVDLILLPIKDEAGRVLFLAPTGTDITDRKRAEADRHKFVSLAENSTDFIGMFDPEGLPFYLNRAGLELVGLEGIEPARRTPIREFFFPEDQPWIVGEFLPSVLERGHGEVEVRFRHFRTGVAVWVLSNVFTLNDPLGNRIGLATVSRDITQRRKLEDDLRGLAADLSEADRRKDEFLATLAHELRNPLAPVRNGLQIMRLAGDDRRAVEEARTLMERQIGHMVRLIDDLMDVSRITRGKLELRKERVDLASVVRNAVETSRPLVESAGHELLVTLPARPITLDADLTRLSQVFANLLNNAAKYTEPGGEIALIAERRGSEVAVTVRDNGVGIPPEMLPRVFEMFTQVDRSLERSQGGLGIGLTLVRTLVEMHGGTIEARSEGQGLGSEFVVRLPVARSLPKPQQSLAPGNGRAVPGEGRRVLVVDDNRDSARTLARLLKLLGHEARAAHDGAEAIEVAEEYRPEVILLDIGLPVMNGYDVAREIRLRPWSHDVLIIALTGWGQDEDRRRSREAGIDRHLVKPVDPSVLEPMLATARA